MPDRKTTTSNQLSANRKVSVMSRKHRHTRPLLALMSILVLAAAVLSACGGSSGDGASAGDTTASDDSTTVAESGELLSNPELPPAPTDLEGADVRAAQEDLLERLEPVEFEATGEPFDISEVTKPVWLVSATSALPPDDIVTGAFVEAAKDAGVPYHVCPGESTPEGNANCLRQAVQEHAGSVVLWSQNITTLAQPLKEARDAGIKVVSGNDAVRIGQEVPAAIDAEVSFNFYDAGLANAAYAVAEKGGSLDSICLYVPEFLVTKAACEGFDDAVAEYCTTCKTEEKEVPLAQFTTQTGAIVSQAVLQNSGLNYIFNSLDDFGALVTAALERTGKSGSEIGQGGVLGTPPALKEVKSGEWQRITVGQNPYWWGWAYLDAGARVQVGASEPTAVATQPTKLLTTETFDYEGPISFTKTNQIFGYGDGAIYKDGFRALWGVESE